MRSVTETDEELSSIEIVRDAKGAFKFTAKLYFSRTGETEVINRLERIMEDLKGRFESE